MSSSIRVALEKLGNAVGKLDCSVANVEKALTEYIPASQVEQMIAGNVIDINFVAKRLDKAIETVEYLLKDEG